MSSRAGGGGSAVGRQCFGVSPAEGTSPNPTGNGAASVCLETRSSPGVAMAPHKEYGRTSSPQSYAANKSPATSSAPGSPLPSTAPTPTAICSPFLMCFAAAPRDRARNVDGLYLCCGRRRKPSQPSLLSTWGLKHLLSPSASPAASPFH